MTTTQHESNDESSEQDSGRKTKDKTIGQVLSHLEESFPDLSASKIRFLEDRGLVFPQRTNTGYRKYSSEDIERLRIVLTLQRDQYLPLKVIKAKVDELERQGFPESGSEAGEPGGEVPAVKARPQQPRRYTMRELSRHTSVDLPMLRELINYGLIQEQSDGTFEQNEV